MADSHSDRIPPVPKYRFEEIAFENEDYRFSVFNSKATGFVADYYSRNRDFHAEFSQTHGEDYFKYSVQKEYLIAETKDFKKGRMLPIFITRKGDPKHIIGRISYFDIIYGGMKTAIVGYSLDKDEIKKGIMTEALKYTMRFLSEYYHLHRVEAYILPKNTRSINLIKRAGFIEEGIKHKYMHINGNWEDHLSFYYLFENNN